MTHVTGIHEIIGLRHLLPDFFGLQGYELVTFRAGVVTSVLVADVLGSISSLIMLSDACLCTSTHQVGFSLASPALRA